MTTLVRKDASDDHGLHDLRAKATELEGVLTERAARVAAMKADLDAFKIRYRQQVGLLHEELDRLEREISDAERGELSGARTGADADTSPRQGAAPVEPLPRFTSDGVRKLFRDVAKAIHPDLAQDDLTRDRRHALMIEANRAYALGDEQQLRWILDAWERSPEAVRGTDLEATRERLERRIAQLDDQLDLLAGDLTSLEASPLWKLKTMVDDAAARGKDLVREMVGRLKRDIMVATNRLDAIRPPR